MIPTASVGPTHAVPIDIDGQGVLDLVVVDEGGSRITWLPGLPAGGYGAAQTIGLGLVQVGCPRPADIDGDLDVDLVVDQASTGALVWFENDGGGLTWTEHSVSGPLGALGAVLPADVDSDGDQDVLVVALDDEQVLLFEYLGAGGFAPGVVVTSAVPGAHCVEVADLDGDGHPDILVSGMKHFQIDSLHVLFNQGDGTFGPALTIASGSLGIWSMVACDFDEDGDQDVLAALGSKIALVWFENDGTGAFGAYQILAWPEAAWELRVADADLDGHLDLFASCSPGITPFVDSLYWLEGDGAGGFSPKTTLCDPDDELSCFALADLDGDGDVDLL
ncbi:MAG: VCBS repeat-containing protein, partial [Proteobacteria bacterium]|nr:VCBS repeat-containing protein [Pseudomonadota bacterium]